MPEPPTFDWRELVPEGWEGRCAYCHGKVTEGHWAANDAIAVVINNEIVSVGHAYHAAGSAQGLDCLARAMGAEAADYLKKKEAGAK